MSDEIVLSFDAGVKEIMKSDWDVASNLAQTIIQETERRNDPYYALDALRVMKRMETASALVKAQILHYLYTNWEKFGIEDNLIHVSLQYGIHNPDVAKRYIAIWDMFENGRVPEQVVDRIKQKPMNDLTPIMGALKLGYNITDEQWEEIAEREGNTAVSDYIRTNVKKIQPRSQTILFRLDKGTGMILATNQGNTYKIAKLNIDSQDEITQIAIRRLLHAIGVLE